MARMFQVASPARVPLSDLLGDYLVPSCSLVDIYSSGSKEMVWHGAADVLEFKLLTARVGVLPGHVRTV